MKNKMLPVKLLEKVCKELFFTAGLNVYQISQQLSISSSVVKSYLKTDKSYPDIEINERLVDEILYDANLPVAKQVIIETEKSRYENYALVEQKSLKIMLQLLDFYERKEPGDIEVDAFKASLAKDFIKATQQCREELLKKYEIDKKSEDNSIKLEFI